MKDGVKYSLNDVAQLREVSDDEAFGTIVKIFQTAQLNEAYVRIRWLFKPQDVFSVKQSFIGERELFDSDIEQDISVGCLYDKVTVLPFAVYHTLEEVECDVYYTRATFLPRELRLEPPLQCWETICLCQAIQNPDIFCLCCDQCSNLYHLDCIQGSIDARTGWICPLCYINPK